MDIIDEFWGELNEGDIHFRDSLQFELKSEFFIDPRLKENIYKQEFFLFIPTTLQINSRTYSRQQFYLDQTNLIRYKTPRLTFKELIQPDYAKSPLTRLRWLINHADYPYFTSSVSDEIKLFGNIFKVAVRDRVRSIMLKLNNPIPANVLTCQSEIDQLYLDLHAVRSIFLDIQNEFMRDHSQSLFRHYFRYTDEFISQVIDHYLTALLKTLRDLHLDKLAKSDQQLCDLIVQERQYREEHHLVPKTSKDHRFANESILYRNSLLEKFMLEALQLTTHRRSLEETHGDLIGALAAGIAMLIYMTLFVWKLSIFVINSIPFVLLAVVFYILKDRVKEGLKRIYINQAFKWFPDYSTEIMSPKGYKIGQLNENFSFIEEKDLPAGFLEIRNRDFHEELQTMKRPETIIQYKKEVILKYSPTSAEERRRELTTLFRLNIHQFLQKANNALQPNLTLDPDSLEIIEQLLPKVYHINIIIRNSALQMDGSMKSEIKKFRVVVDKVGIKRVEQIK